ncbi:hypothetical protein RT0542 [Rickettsia typhi str. Wilmington]|uniref:Uncharacterized protein n=1 Tax=Rickettsia typhi (strain ATCC VR-144 / Wilmington) TaxID=257363 RepID=Q68WI1_RICTY|nr:hypothetical protein RT0542 [Rickettsia typhi str. Wilmington]
MELNNSSMEAHFVSVEKNQDSEKI